MTPRTASAQPPQLAEHLPSRTFRLREEEGRMAGWRTGWAPCARRCGSSSQWSGMRG